MRIQVSIKVSNILLIFLLLITITCSAQRNQKNNSNKDFPVQIQHVSNFFVQHPPISTDDSIFSDAFYYLLNLSLDDKLKENVFLTQQMINENKASTMLFELFSFKKKVDSLNLLRSRFMEGYWQYKEWQKATDTIDSPLVNSALPNLMDTTLFKDSIYIDSVFQALKPYNDSLVKSIDQSIAFFAQNQVVQWIKQMRQDTINFYIINIDGDSLLVHLYENSPEMIRFSITDYWGTNIKAVIRDIDKHSIRILVDNAPELNYETNEKAKKALGNLRVKPGKNKNITITYRKIEQNKEKWMLWGNTNVDLSQVHFSESWAKGGESSYSLMTGLELFANYKKGIYSWENKGIFKYGAIRQGKSNYFKPTEDRIELGTKFGYKLFGNYFLSALSTFKSQFSSGYEYPNDTSRNLVSKFMNPGYVTFALGMDFKPNIQTTLFISPLSSKTTIVSSHEINHTKYGLDSTQQFRHETGAIIKAGYKRKIWGDIEMENYMELFSNYFDHPQNIDVDWDFKLIFPVNDFIRSTISTRIIYDDNQSVPKYKNDASGNRISDGTTKAIQFKELLTIGFAMKF